MKLDQLSYFLEAAKFEHLGRAARALNISAGAISHSISALEEEFGRNLFEKRGKRIHLTEHGKLLVERAKRLLSDADTIRDELTSDKLELRGHFRMAGAHVLCSKFLLPAWVKLQNENPSLTGEVFTLRSSQVALGVIEREFDFGLCFNPQSHIDLASQSLCSGQLLVAVRKGHPLSGKGVKYWVKNLSHFTATFPKAFQGIEVCEMHPVFETYGISVRTDCLVDSYRIALEKVALSNSWSFLPDWLIREDKRLKALSHPPGWNAPYHVTAVWPRQGIPRQAMTRLLNKIEKTVLNS